MRIAVTKLAHYFYSIYSSNPNMQDFEQNIIPQTADKPLYKEEEIFYKLRLPSELMGRAFQSINNLKELTRKHFLIEAEKEMLQKDIQMLQKDTEMLKKTLEDISKAGAPLSFDDSKLRSHYLICLMISQPSEEIFDEFIFSINLANYFSENFSQCLHNARITISMLKSFNYIQESRDNEDLWVNPFDISLIQEIHNIFLNHRDFTNSELQDNLKYFTEETNFLESFKRDLSTLKIFVDNFQIFFKPTNESPTKTPASSTN